MSSIPEERPAPSASPGPETDSAVAETSVPAPQEQANEPAATDPQEAKTAATTVVAADKETDIKKGETTEIEMTDLKSATVAVIPATSSLSTASASTTAAPSANAAAHTVADASAGMPDLTITYHNLAVSVEISDTAGQVETLIAPIQRLATQMTNGCASGIGHHSFARLTGATGCIRPGTMTLVLAPPGHGKSTFLKALAQKLPLDADDDAVGVRYNGRSMAQATAEGCDIRRLCQYVDQVCGTQFSYHSCYSSCVFTGYSNYFYSFIARASSINTTITSSNTISFVFLCFFIMFLFFSSPKVDEHMPLLTVRETLDFAHRCTSSVYDPARVDAALAMLGLEGCQDTILGNALIRGVSGGQKRRVTVGEMMVGDARALFLDEYTNGLDSATAEDITRSLRQWALRTRGTVVTTAQQPTPGLFACYDDVIIMSNAQIVYHGPREDAQAHLAAMGFHCPADVDICDFLMDCVSQPKAALQRLERAPPAAGQVASGALAPAAAPCTTTSAMIAHFTASPTYAVMLPSVKAAFPQAALQIDSAVASAKKAAAIADSDSAAVVAMPAVDTAVEHASLMPSEAARAAFKAGGIHSESALLRLVLWREAVSVVRNTDVLLPRLIQAAIIGVIFGSMFWQLTEADFLLRTAMLVVIVAQVAYFNAVELPISCQNSRIVYRQTAAGFYSTWSYVGSTAIVAIPVFVTECVLISVSAYFMSDCNPTAECFFAYLGILITQALNMSVWFRFITVLFPAEATASALGGPSVGIFMILAGFFVSMSAMPIWMSWIMWLCPFAWTIRAMANIEFMSDRYSAITDAGITVGEAYMAELDFRVGDKWIGFAVLYLIGITVIMLVAHALMMRQPYYTSSIGTRRVEDEEEQLESEEERAAEAAFHARAEADNDEREFSVLSGMPYSYGDVDGHVSSTVSAVTAQGMVASPSSVAAASTAAIDSVNALPPPAANGSSLPSSASAANASSASLPRAASSTFGEDTLKTLREALPFTPMWMSFNDLHYTVKIPGEHGQTVDKPLLQGVTGYAEPGRMTALMGASGAGKTTLLDVLAGRKNTGIIDGKVTLNGHAATAEAIAAYAGYVEQFDSLFPYDTVRETLAFAAHLRLPASVSSEIKERIVDEVMDILELTPIRDNIIGCAGMLGLSPSQLKRVNIGCELVANPAILFLDEPTTGLDSRAAQTVMRVVRRIARSGRAVICTIHQPSAELFYLFDRLVLLAPGGHQIFFGDLGKRCRRFIPYIESIPRVTPCPPRCNPASWMLEEGGVGQASGAEASAAAAKAGIEQAGRFDDPTVILERFKSSWANSKQLTVARAIVRDVEALGDGDADKNTTKAPALAAPAQVASAGKSDIGSEAEANAAAGLISPLPDIPENPELASANDNKDGEAEDGSGSAVGSSSAAPAAGGAMSHTVVVLSAGTARTTEPAPSVGGHLSHAESHVSTRTLFPLPTQRQPLVISERGTPLNKLYRVFVRTFNGYWRNSPVMLTRLVTVTLISVFFGLVYFDLNSRVSTQSDAISLMGAILVSCNFGALVHGSSALPHYMQNRAVLYRESASKMYAPALWSLTTILNDMLWCILTTFLVQVPSYFLVDLSTGAPFWQYYLITYLICLVYLTIANLLAAGTPNMGAAGIYQGLSFGLLLVFSGLILPYPKLPRGWVWLFRILPLSHATEALIMPQVGDCSPLPMCGPLITMVENQQPVQVPLPLFISEYLGFGFHGFGDAVGWMVLFVAVVQILALIAISVLNFSKR